MTYRRAIASFAMVFSHISVALGAMLMGLALSTHGERRTISLGTHATFDYLLAGFAILTALALAFGSAPAVATAFLAGFGAAHLALTASTRFSVRGA